MKLKTITAFSCKPLKERLKEKSKTKVQVMLK